MDIVSHLHTQLWITDLVINELYISPFIPTWHFNPWDPVQIAQFTPPPLIVNAKTEVLQYIA